MSWRSWLGIGPKDPAFSGYSEAFDRPWPSSTPLNAVRFAVLDTETTGLNPAKDHILSIAAIAVSGEAMHMQDSFHALLQHTQVTQSVAIHMITPASAEAGGLPAKVIKDFALWVQHAVLVGHHIAFDASVLSHTLRRYKGCSLQNKMVDTALLAIRLLEPPHAREQLQPADYSLDKLADRLQIPIFERHTAEGDTLTTALVFLKLLHLAQVRGIRTLGELLR